MRLLVAASLVLLVGCSYSVDGSGPAPSEEQKTDPTPTESEEIVSGEQKNAPTPIKASDIKGVSVSIDGVTQPIAQGVVQVSNGNVYVELRPRGGGPGSYNTVTMNIDHAGTGCSRTGDNFTQSLMYFPMSSTQENDDPIYYSPSSLNCGLNILELDKRRDGRVVGIYDGELRREWGGAVHPRTVHAVIKFNLPMPEQQPQP